MAIATSADVQRWLGDTVVDPAVITAALEAAEEWVQRYTGYDWGASGSKTEDFYNERQDAILYTRNWNPTITSITVFASPDTSIAGRALGLSQYMKMTRGRIHLVFDNTISVAGYDPAALGSVQVGHYRLTRVVYTADAIVPFNVREAAAIIAAADIANQVSGLSVSGLQSESIGDYSYTMKSSSGDGALESAIPASAIQKLAPYTGKRARTV